jgi:hypothetical protein
VAATVVAEIGPFLLGFAIAWALTASLGDQLGAAAFLVSILALCGVGAIALDAPEGMKLPGLFGRFARGHESPGEEPA